MTTTNSVMSNAFFMAFPSSLLLKRALVMIARWTRAGRKTTMAQAYLGTVPILCSWMAAVKHEKFREGGLTNQTF